MSKHDELPEAIYIAGDQGGDDRYVFETDASLSVSSKLRKRYTVRYVRADTAPQLSDEDTPKFMPDEIWIAEEPDGRRRIAYSDGPGYVRYDRLSHEEQELLNWYRIEREDVIADGVTYTDRYIRIYATDHIVSQTPLPELSDEERQAIEFLRMSRKHRMYANLKVIYEDSSGRIFARCHDDHVFHPIGWVLKQRVEEVRPEKPTVEGIINSLRLGLDDGFIVKRAATILRAWDAYQNWRAEHE